VRTLVPLLAGMIGALTLVVGAQASALVSHPGAVLRQAQSMQIDGALGKAEQVPTPDGPMMVWEHGPEVGPEVVLVHGFGDAAAGWVPTTLVLGKTHHVTLFDLPGHGRSSPRGDSLSMEQLEAGLQTVMDRTDGEVVLVGNSLGGWLAARYALDHPDRVKHLVLVNAAGLAQDVPRDLLLPTSISRQHDKNRAVLGEHVPDLPDFAMRGMLQLNGAPRLHALFDQLEQGGFNIDERVGSLSVPVTFVWGTPDPFFPVDGYLDRYQRALPSARTVTLDGCGHAPQYSCESDLAGAIIEASE